MKVFINLEYLFLGLFQKAIMQSGCIFNAWGFNAKHSTDAAFKLAKLMGCEKDDPKDIVEFLQNIPAHDLVKSSSSKIKFEVSIKYLSVNTYEVMPVMIFLLVNLYRGIHLRLVNVLPHRSVDLFNIIW